MYFSIPERLIDQKPYPSRIWHPPCVIAQFGLKISLRLPVGGYEVFEDEDTEWFFRHYKGCSLGKFLHLLLNPRSDYYRIFFKSRASDHRKMIDVIRHVIGCLNNCIIPWNGLKIADPCFKNPAIIQALQAIMDVYPDQAFERHVRQLVERSLNPETISADLPDSLIENLPQESKIPGELLERLAGIAFTEGEEDLDVCLGYLGGKLPMTGKRP